MAGFTTYICWMGARRDRSLSPGTTRNEEIDANGQPPTSHEQKLQYSITVAALTVNTECQRGTSQLRHLHDCPCIHISCTTRRNARGAPILHEICRMKHHSSAATRTVHSHSTLSKINTRLHAGRFNDDTPSPAHELHQQQVRRHIICVHKQQSHRISLQWRNFAMSTRRQSPEIILNLLNEN